MHSFSGKSAVVIGGSSGVGKAVVIALLSEGAVVTAVARGSGRLQELKAETNGRVSTVQGDATNPEFTDRLLRELKPDLVIITAGTAPRMMPIHQFDWDSFSENWNTDLKASFHLIKQALTLPLRPGSKIVTLSSGAAVHGSPLSGGYAGAKRMQWFLTNYAQAVSEQKKLGIRLLAVLPRPVAGTTIGRNAAEKYGPLNGITPEAFLERIGVTVDKVVSGVLAALRDEIAPEYDAILVTPDGIQPLSLDSL